MDYVPLVKAVNEVLCEYRVKLTLRQLYYRLVSKGLIPNTKASYKGLSKQLVKARETGAVDGDRIEDRGRKVQGSGDYGCDGSEEEMENFLKRQIERLQEAPQYYSRKMWLDQPKNVIVALEKDALSRIFVDAASGFRVQVYATKGYSSYTFVNDLAGSLDQEKENIILYFGDYDPSGRDIQRDLTDRLSRYSGLDNISVIRIALTPEQISEYKLPPMPEDAETLAKLRRDPRAKQYGMTYAVELDAIDPKELSRLIKNAVMKQIDSDEWQRVIEEQAKETQELEAKFKGVKVIFSDGTEITQGID
jgi:hypothetical protein